MNKKTLKKTFNLIDYKGKYYVIQDKDIDDEGWDYVIGTISRETALEKDFVKEHKANCRYYGIPPIITKDKDLLKAYGENVETKK